MVQDHYRRLATLVCSCKVACTVLQGVNWTTFPCAPSCGPYQAPGAADACAANLTGRRVPIPSSALPAHNQLPPPRSQIRCMRSAWGVWAVHTCSVEEACRTAPVLERPRGVVRRRPCRLPAGPVSRPAAVHTRLHATCQGRCRARAAPYFLAAGSPVARRAPAAAASAVTRRPAAAISCSVVPRRLLAPEPTCRGHGRQASGQCCDRQTPALRPLRCTTPVWTRACATHAAHRIHAAARCTTETRASQFFHLQNPPPLLHPLPPPHTHTHRAGHLDATRVGGRAVAHGREGRRVHIYVGGAALGIHARVGALHQGVRGAGERGQGRR